jgi:glycosyltransferase involved in cell wall biosynthesis
MQPDLVVFSHLRWTGVWQRPQHLISRIGRGRRTWFVEEPWPCAVDRPVLRTEDAGPVIRVWLDVPEEGLHVHFDDPALEVYARELPALLGRSRDRIVWLYTPLPIDIASSLEPKVVVFDVMDDLSSFREAPEQLVLRHRRALHRADVVFAGGRTLHRRVLAQRPDAHLFPSGVEPEHYERARAHRTPRARPVAGYVGVLDERVDLELVAGLAAGLPDWDIRMVGPVAKIDPTLLPAAPNLHYLGPRPYDRLPEVMGDFDVALMPFALNDATRSISPTKTLEYLAAGLPVVSTRIADVVADFGSVVDLQDDAAGFAAACRRVLAHDVSDRDRKLRPVLFANHWDEIARRMGTIVDGARTGAKEVSA